MDKMKGWRTHLDTGILACQIPWDKLVQLNIEEHNFMEDKHFVSLKDLRAFTSLVFSSIETLSLMQATTLHSSRLP